MFTRQSASLWRWYLYWSGISTRILYLPVLRVKTNALLKMPFTFTVKGHCTVPRNAGNVRTWEALSTRCSVHENCWNLYLNLFHSKKTAIYRKRRIFLLDRIYRVFENRQARTSCLHRNKGLCFLEIITLTF